VPAQACFDVGELGALLGAHPGELTEPLSLLFCGSFRARAVREG
jgi:hypothetical protein